MRKGHSAFEILMTIRKPKSEIFNQQYRFTFENILHLGSEIAATNTAGVQFGRWLFIASRVNFSTVLTYQTKDCIEFKPILQSWYLIL